MTTAKIKHIFSFLVVTEKNLTKHLKKKTTIQELYMVPKETVSDLYRHKHNHTHTYTQHTSYKHI